MSSYGKEWKTSQPFELDYNEQLRQAYYDCVVALNALETRQFSFEGMSGFENTVSFPRFIGCVNILSWMITEETKDADYKKEVPNGDGIKYDSETIDQAYHQAGQRFHAISELFNRKKIFKPAKAGWVSHL